MAEPASSPPKSIHTIVLDAGPIIKNSPPLSTLLAQCDEIITTPAVVSEIRDPDARARIETLYLPFLKQRTPNPKSFNIVSEFARKTGDRSVLSRNDIEVLALAYEIECERNGGDWRLRSVPGQKRVNGAPPAPVKEEEQKLEEEPKEDAESKDVEAITEGVQEATIAENTEVIEHKETGAVNKNPVEVEENGAEEDEEDVDLDTNEDDAADSDGGEWITPTNYKKRLARDDGSGATAGSEVKVMQVATMTTDFAVSVSSFICKCIL